MGQEHRGLERVGSMFSVLSLCNETNADKISHIQCSAIPLYKGRKKSPTFLNHCGFHFRTVPTQCSKRGFFSHDCYHICESVSVCVRFYLYKKINNCRTLCINNSSSFARFCSPTNKIVETSSRIKIQSRKKKKGKKSPLFFSSFPVIFTFLSKSFFFLLLFFETEFSV